MSRVVADFCVGDAVLRLSWGSSLSFCSSFLFGVVCHWCRISLKIPLVLGCLLVEVGFGLGGRLLIDFLVVGFRQDPRMSFYLLTLLFPQG